MISSLKILCAACSRVLYFPSANHATAASPKSSELADEETKRQYYWNFLEKLRRSGVTNMFGAAPYLMEEFGLSKSEANKILGDWMKNYNPDDYKDLK